MLGDSKHGGGGALIHLNFISLETTRTFQIQEKLIK